MNVVKLGRGGSLVDSSFLVRRVASSNPALAAWYGPWASHSLVVAFGASAYKLRYNIVRALSGGSMSSRGLKRRYGNSLYE